MLTSGEAHHLNEWTWMGLSVLESAAPRPDYGARVIAMSTVQDRVGDAPPKRAIP